MEGKDSISIGPWQAATTSYLAHISVQKVPIKPHPECQLASFITKKKTKQKQNMSLATQTFAAHGLSLHCLICPSAEDH